MTNPPISDDELNAYLDGELPEAALREFERRLAGDAAALERLQAWLRQRGRLHEVFDPVLDEPLPARLLAAAAAPPAVVAAPPGAAAAAAHYDAVAAASARAATVDATIGERPAPRPADAPAGGAGRPLSPLDWFTRLAAGVLLLVAGGVLGWALRGAGPAPPATALERLPRQAALAHAVFTPDVRRPVEISAAQQDQLVTWLSRRLGVPVKPPQLGAQGYELVGGRLLPGDSGPVAQFMYQDAGGQRLTLYLTHDMPGGGQTAFRFAREGELNVFYWVDGSFGYALSGGADREQLARLATAVYEQLERRASAGR